MQTRQVNASAALPVVRQTDRGGYLDRLFRLALSKVAAVIGACVVGCPDKTLTKARLRPVCVPASGWDRQRDLPWKRVWICGELTLEAL